MRAALRRKEDFPGGWERTFSVGMTSDGELAAVVGCQLAPDQTLGWLWGPWMSDERQWRDPFAPALLDHLGRQLPPSVRQLEAFFDRENRDALTFLQARGFSLGPVTHIYVAHPATESRTLEEKYAALGVAHEVAFARLHVETFPTQGGIPAHELLAGRDDEHRIFAATDGLRLLGYVCVSINRAPLEGFIDYLAVRESARGRGVGAGLLRRAQRWAWVECRLPQIALCVSDWRSGARRLYEQSGFTLAASGVAARCQR